MDEYLHRLLFYQKRDFTAAQFKEFLFSLTTPNIEMMELIRQLKAAYDLKIFAVSNEAKEINEFRIHKFQLNLFIDFFISSCYVQVRKPDSAIFKLALNGAQVPADRIVYIDNVQMFTDVATDLGIRSIWHKNHASTAEELAELGLKIK